MDSSRKRGIPKGPLHKFLLADFLVAVIALVLAFLIKFIRDPDWVDPFPAENFLFIVYLFPVLFAVRFFILLKFRLYDFRVRHTVFDIVYLSLGAILLSRVIEGFVVYYVTLYWSPQQLDLQPSREILFVWDPAILWLGCCSWRLLYLQKRHRWAYDRTRVLIVGAGLQGASIRRDISEYSALGHEVIGLVDDGIDQAQDPDVLGTLDDVASLVDKHDVDEIIVATERGGRDDILRILSKCFESEVQVRLLPALYEVAIGRVEIGEVAGIPLIAASREPLTDWGRFFKRAEDLFIAVLGVLVMFPFYPVIAALIKRSSPGPVFYRQRRVGRNEVPFTLLKFRTMYWDAEASSGPVLSWLDDPRVTPIGRILRRLHLDELPQLLNVLVGQMSVVGPRPERPEFAREFSERIPSYRLRFSVRPGMTGLAQIHGYYDSPVEHKLRYDLAYISNISVLLDLKILLRTLNVTLGGRELVREKNGELSDEEASRRELEPGGGRAEGPWRVGEIRNK